MTTRLLLRLLLSTWLLLIPLPWCLDNLGAMLVWLFALSVYLVLVVIPSFADSGHIDQRLLPEDRGLPAPSSYPPMPKVVAPFRFVGLVEKKGKAPAHYTENTGPGSHVRCSCERKGGCR